MLTDLEHALAVEAARAGQASSEATTVLRALPGDTADRAAAAPAAARAGAEPPGGPAVTAVVVVLVAAWHAPRRAPRAAPPAQAPPAKPLPRDPLGLRRIRPLRQAATRTSTTRAPRASDRREPRHLLDHRDLPGRRAAEGRRWHLRGRRQPGRRSAAPSWSAPSRFDYEARSTARSGHPAREHPGLGDRVGSPVVAGERSIAINTKGEVQELPRLDHEAAARPEQAACRN